MNVAYRGLAEGEGFEPPVTCATAVFKTAAFDRSAIPPMAMLAHVSKAGLPGSSKTTVDHPLKFEVWETEVVGAER